MRARWNSLKRSKISSTATASSNAGVDKTTASKKSRATPKKVKPEVDVNSAKKIGKKGKATVKIEEEAEALDSVEGPDGVALGFD